MSGDVSSKAEAVDEKEDSSSSSTVGTYIPGSVSTFLARGSSRYGMFFKPKTPALKENAPADKLEYLLKQALEAGLSSSGPTLEKILEDILVLLKGNHNLRSHVFSKNNFNGNALDLALKFNFNQSFVRELKQLGMTPSKNIKALKNNDTTKALINSNVIDIERFQYRPKR